MRLLLTESADYLGFTRDLSSDEIPPYAISSHTWGADGDEVTFQDVTNGIGASKSGYQRIKFCAAQSRPEEKD